MRNDFDFILKKVSNKLSEKLSFLLWLPFLRLFLSWVILLLNVCQCLTSYIENYVCFFFVYLCQIKFLSVSFFYWDFSFSDIHFMQVSIKEMSLSLYKYKSKYWNRTYYNPNKFWHECIFWTLWVQFKYNCTHEYTFIIFSSFLILS